MRKLNTLSKLSIIVLLIIVSANADMSIVTDDIIEKDQISAY